MAVKDLSIYSMVIFYVLIIDFGDSVSKRLLFNAI